MGRRLAAIACGRAGIALAGALVLVGCGGGGRVRPAVMPNLAEMPSDPQQRAHLQESAGARPGPENGQPGNRAPSKKMVRAETAAATAAAIIGSMFSSSPNVILGTGTVFDETAPFLPAPSQGSGVGGTGSTGDLASCPGAHPADTPPGLFPWRCDRNAAAPGKQAPGKQAPGKQAPAKQAPPGAAPDGRSPVGPENGRRKAGH